MRIFGLSLAVLCCVSSATPGTAQKAGGDVVSADQKEIGKLQTHILKYEQALASSFSWRAQRCGCRMQWRVLFSEQQQADCMEM